MDEVRKITLKKYPLKKFDLKVGDKTRISLKVKEGNKQRVQVFEGVVLKIQGKDFNRSVTVRKISSGVGVEKTIPLASPNLSGVELLSRSKVRRARLFYLRKLKGRSARLSIK
ncbi:MAG: 50S ribosomal protein L19 [Bdellovibrionales bacterium]|nr:50S ribosomal protein L19 [Bdellovibrionales bacterium]